MIKWLMLVGIPPSLWIGRSFLGLFSSATPLWDGVIGVGIGGMILLSVLGGLLALCLAGLILWVGMMAFWAWIHAIGSLFIRAGKYFTVPATTRPHQSSLPAPEPVCAIRS